MKPVEQGFTLIELMIVVATSIDTGGTALDLSSSATTIATFGWKCGATSSTGVRTTIAPRFLPVSCR